MKIEELLPHQWTPPCNSQCTKKYAALMHIPWRVFCKKGCDADAETFDDCLGDCDDLCYKDPVLKDQKWSAIFDRSPGAESYSQECFRACVSGCGYKFDVPQEKVDDVHARPPKPPPEKKPAPPVDESTLPNPTNDDILGSSA